MGVHNNSYCLLEPKTASFGHCFDYTFKDPRREGETRHSKVFVLRDCEYGFILPGEWQHPHFGHSFSPESYSKNHIQRFSWNNFAATRKKPVDNG